MSRRFRPTEVDPRPIAVLSIAGSDSGGGAGIQADLRTIAAFGLHGTCAITAITAQNTRAVTAVQRVSGRVLEAQIDALFDDFRIAAVKVGMLGDATTVRRVARCLARRPGTPVVLDPVMIASSGARLLAPDAVTALRDRLLPQARVLTPNLPEAEVLLGRRIPDATAMPEAAAALQALGCPAVLLKGGHLPRGAIVDLLRDGASVWRYRHRRLAREGHGTGCTLSSALACGLARGEPLPEATRRAVDYVHRALAIGPRPGRGSVHVLVPPSP